MRSCSLVAAIAAVLIALLLAYPGHRVVDPGFEFLTDGQMPDAVARVAQRALSRMWRDGFDRGLAAPRELIDAIDDLGIKSIVEIAAGSGVAPVMWQQSLRLTPVVTLTDLQPSPGDWARLSHAAAAETPGAVVSCINRSVDATNLSAALVGGDDDRGGAELRTIHAALHHFPPPLVKKVLADAIVQSKKRAAASFLIGDLAPSRGGVAWNWLMAYKYGLSAPDPIGDVRELLSELPWWGIALLPAMPFFAAWDATASELRAYSSNELTEILRSIDGFEEERFDVKVFTSQSFGRMLFGLPEAWSTGVCASWLGLDQPVIQWVLIGTIAASSRR